MKMHISGEDLRTLGISLAAKANDNPSGRFVVEIKSSGYGVDVDLTGSQQKSTLLERLRSGVIEM